MTYSIDISQFTPASMHIAINNEGFAIRKITVINANNVQGLNLYQSWHSEQSGKFSYCTDHDYSIHTIVPIPSTSVGLRDVKSAYPELFI